MRRRYARLSIHRKLVVLALAVTTIALALSTAVLAVFDLRAYRGGAYDEMASLAEVLAENLVAAVRFDDVDGARETLQSVRVRPSIRRACLYLPDGSLLAGFARSPAFTCPASQPSASAWSVVDGSASIAAHGKALGTVYVERDLGEIGPRAIRAAVTGVVALFLAVPVAFVVAHRLNRSVSGPIVSLAAAARTVRAGEGGAAVLAVDAGQDEVGDLVRSLGAMLRRLDEGNAERERLLLREQEAGRLKDEFLATVSHELRTPLNAIVGWVEILSSSTPDEETLAKALPSIARNTRAQARVIEDLVDISRIVTGKVRLSLSSTDLGDVVEAAVDTVRSAADAKNIVVNVDVPTPSCSLVGDRDRLLQVIWNLLSNAIKFTPIGGRVAVSLRDAPDGCELVVSDSGIGIAPAFLPHVFDRFRQADGSPTREHGGLGLGLAIVKELTELHGGSVTAVSAGPGQGASFSVRLPRRATADVAVAGECAGIRSRCSLC